MNKGDILTDHETGRQYTITGTRKVFGGGRCWDAVDAEGRTLSFYPDVLAIRIASGRYTVGT